MNALLPLLCFGVLLPAVLAGVCVLIVRRVAPPGAAHVRSGAVLGALAAGAGYLGGHFGLRGWRGFVPRESTDWIAVIALIGLLVGAAGVTRRVPPGARSWLRLLIAAAASWLLLGRFLARGQTGTSVLADVATYGAGIAVAWSALDKLARPDVRGGPLLLVLLLAVGAAAVLIVSGSALLGQLAGALAAALGAALLLTLRDSGAALLHGAAPVVALTLGALLLAGLHFADMPGNALVALLLAPVTALAVRVVADLRAGRRAAVAPAGSGGAVPLVQTLCVLALVATAIGLSLAASPSGAEAQGY